MEVLAGVEEVLVEMEESAEPLPWVGVPAELGTVVGGLAQAIASTISPTRPTVGAPAP